MERIRYLVMDVDGTLTDGKIYMSGSGECYKAFNIKDGYGIHDIAIPLGIIPIIITGRKSDIVKCRCVELGIEHVYQGIFDKKDILYTIAEDLSLVAYIGDDINDIECMESVKLAGGLIGCPNDAVKNVKDIVDFISSRNGGDGAVREFIDWIITNNN